jgi:hypothetical protein
LEFEFENGDCTNSAHVLDFDMCTAAMNFMNANGENLAGVHLEYYRGSYPLGCNKQTDNTIWYNPGCEYGCNAVCSVTYPCLCCLSFGVDPEGDKRYKTTWVTAIKNRELAEGKLQLGSPCPNATRVDATTITCTVPPGAGRDVQLTITVGGETSSFFDDDATYDYAVPVPSAIIVPTTNNGYLVLDGPEFGINAPPPRWK